MEWIESSGGVPPSDPRGQALSPVGISLRRLSAERRMEFGIVTAGAGREAVALALPTRRPFHGFRRGVDVFMLEVAASTGPFQRP